MADERFSVPPDVQQQVLVRSWEDPEFRELVSSDPRAALSQLGFEVTSDIEVKVVPQGNSELTLLVADHPAGEPLTPSGDFKPQENWTSRGGGCGNTCTLTGECGCPTDGTLTCGCACGSIVLCRD
jgi:hypothetical protein